VQFWLWLAGALSLGGLTDVDMTSLLTSLLPTRHRQQQRRQSLVARGAGRPVNSQSAQSSMPGHLQQQPAAGGPGKLDIQHRCKTLG